MMMSAGGKTAPGTCFLKSLRVFLKNSVKLSLFLPIKVLEN